MNGSLKLPLVRGRHYTVYGGRYRARPAEKLGVKMAVEIQADCEIDIPTKDFNVPNVVHMTIGLEDAVALITEGQPLYVGCMGGIGRTGLFLAILAKAWGIEDPVGYVRVNYMAHAVETEQQKQYVANFAISEDVTRMVKKAKLRAWFKAFWSRKKDLTQTHSDAWLSEHPQEDR